MPTMQEGNLSDSFRLRRGCSTEEDRHRAAWGAGRQAREKGRARSRALSRSRATADPGGPCNQSLRRPGGPESTCARAAAVRPEIGARRRLVVRDVRRVIRPEPRGPVRPPRRAARRPRRHRLEQSAPRTRPSQTRRPRRRTSNASYYRNEDIPRAHPARSGARNAFALEQGERTLQRRAAAPIGRPCSCAPADGSLPLSGRATRRSWPPIERRRTAEAGRPGDARPRRGSRASSSSTCWRYAGVRAASPPSMHPSAPGIRSYAD